MSEGIKQIIANSQKAREERQAAAEKRRQELAAKREAAFKPLYERIQTARENVQKIQEDLADGVYKGKPVTSVAATTPVPIPTPVVTTTTVSTADTAGSSPSPTPATPSTVAAVPSTISPVTQTPPPPPVKTAPIDTILFDNEAVPVEIMADLIFENIGGQELINIARNDTVNGQAIIYQPIKNLTSIQQEYNPNNIVALQATSDKYFENFAIKFDTKVPETGTGENGAHVYIDPETGSFVIEAINLDPDEQIELEITTSGTIYEADI